MVDLESETGPNAPQPRKALEKPQRKVQPHRCNARVEDFLQVRQRCWSMGAVQARHFLDYVTHTPCGVEPVHIGGFRQSSACLEEHATLFQV